MRAKIAFLTILVINVVGFGGYWLIKFLGWQASWVLHTFPGNHACPKDDVPLYVIVVLTELIGGVLAFGVSCLIKWAIQDLYKKIDNLFPEKKT